MKHWESVGDNSFLPESMASTTMADQTDGHV